MTNEEYKQKILTILKKITKDTFIRYNEIQFLNALYLEMFGEIPHSIAYNAYDYLGYKSIDEYRTKKLKSELKIKVDETMYNLYYNIDKIPCKNKYVIKCDNMSFHDFIFFLDDVIIAKNLYMSHGLFICYKQLQIPEFIHDYICYEEDELSKIHFMVHTNYGFDTETLNVDKKYIDLHQNYNDDLPDAEISKFLTLDNESGIIILHGKPGTGKTTYIRSLVNKLHKEFIYADFSCFSYINDSSFISFLLEHKNSIIIFEDCEKLLQKRENGQNSLIQCLLNLSDGLLSDMLNIKFICTFNCDLNDIDDAILRKGRLKVKYDFRELSLEKTKALAEKLGITLNEEKQLVLSDIYNYEETPDINKKETKKLGF